MVRAVSGKRISASARGGSARSRLRELSRVGASARSSALARQMVWACVTQRGARSNQRGFGILFGCGGDRPMLAKPTISCATLWLLVVSSATAAEAASACDEALAPTDPGVMVVRCESVVVAAEIDAARSSARLMADHRDVIQLDAGAFAVSVKAHQRPFRTLTPDAVIASQSGEWAVSVLGGVTHVTVWRGDVSLRRRMDGSESLLRAGQSDETPADPARMERLRAVLQKVGDAP